MWLSSSGFAMARFGRGPRGVGQALGEFALRGDPPFRRQLGQRPPELLGDERHERVEQAEHLVEHRGQHLARGGSAVVVAQARLDQLEIPVAGVVPEEVTGRGDCARRVVVLEGAACTSAVAAAQAGENPAILDFQILDGPADGTWLPPD